MARSVRVLGLAFLIADAAALAVVHGLLLASGGGPAGAAVVAAAAQLTGLAATGAYSRTALQPPHRQVPAIARGLTCAAVVLAAGAYLGGADLPRDTLVLGWALGLLVMSLVRIGAWPVLRALRRRGRFVERVLVAGADADGVALARRMESSLEHGVKVVGFLDDYRSPGTPVTDGLTVLAPPRAAGRVARVEGASRVIVVPQALAWESLRDLLELDALGDGPRVCWAPRFHDAWGRALRPMEGGGAPLWQAETTAIRGWGVAAKRALDLALALVLLPVLACELAVAWACARIDGGGPLVRRREALGRRGRPLPLLAMAAPESAAPTVRWRRAAWEARRTLAGGRWSKLPNLVNVLTGRMSLVGPRALLDATGNGSRAGEQGDLPGLVPDDGWRAVLASVRPGLTGPKAGAGSGTEAQAQADVAYVRSYSLWLDLALLMESARRALRRDGTLPVCYPAPALGPAAGAAWGTPWTG